MMPTHPRAVLFMAMVMAATTPMPRQFQVMFPSELGRPILPSAVPGTTVLLMKYEAAGSPNIQDATVKTVRAAAGRQERSNIPLGVLGGSDLNEAHIKYKLSNILRDLGIGTGSPGHDIASSKIMIHKQENLRAEGLASQMTNLFRRGTTESAMPRSEDGDSQKKDYSEDKDKVADDDIDDQGCGVQQPEPRILGGTEAWMGAWPWVAAMVHAPSGRPYCGASLINSRFLLTAGHCAAM
ncbi:Enteropeptidase [Portunus trituberculatus]|uniref:Enteropeptidase n=1 Tax=Portunus trituberculatus TaxID=210409 RepID=A0A5B7H9S9_PORTR|nr:Enteropeptidase [Portunus trituberculatus]